MRGLYAIVDVEALSGTGISVLEAARAVLIARPAALQLRAKASPARDVLTALGALQRECRAADVPLYANDRPDLAVLAGADGVHVGQDDLDVADVRRFAPSLKVGTSTHSLEQVRAALAAAPDYVAFGPVFATQSKRGADPTVGLDGLREASRLARAAGVPLVAIGGIDYERAAAVAAHADAAAVIAALWRPPLTAEDITRRARALHAALGGAA